MNLTELNTIAEKIKPMTFVAACRQFFGVKPGQPLQDFAAELRALTPGDKQELIALFPSVGIDATKTA